MVPKKSRYSRRAVIAGTAGTFTVGPKIVHADNYTEILAAEGPDGYERWEKVPVEWLEHMEALKSAQADLMDKFSISFEPEKEQTRAPEGVASVTIRQEGSPLEAPNGHVDGYGMPELVIVHESNITPPDNIAEEVKSDYNIPVSVEVEDPPGLDLSDVDPNEEIDPDPHAGTDVIFVYEDIIVFYENGQRQETDRERYETKIESNQCLEGPHDPIPGGVIGQCTVAGRGSLSENTLGFPGRDGSGDIGMFHCSHVFYEECNDDPEGQQLWEPYQNDNYIGQLLDYSYSADWSFIDARQADAGLANTIRGATGNLVGHVTEAGLDSLISSNETCYKRGRATCFESGRMTERGISRTVCGFTARHYTSSTMDRAGGDSGGPTFRYNSEDNQEAISIHRGRHSDGSLGYACYRIADIHNYQFGL